MPAKFNVVINRRASREEIQARLVQAIFGTCPPYKVRELTVTQKRGEKVGDTFARAYTEGLAAAGTDHDVEVHRV